MDNENEPIPVHGWIERLVREHFADADAGEEPLAYPVRSYEPIYIQLLLEISNGKPKVVSAFRIENWQEKEVENANEKRKKKAR